jgi:hypothetical protein
MSTYNVEPANKSCINVQNKNIVTNSPGSENAASLNSVNNINNQLETSNQYDNVNNFNIKPMNGGNKNSYNIEFKKNLYVINNVNNEKDAIKKLINNKIYKIDYILNIKNNSTKKVKQYILRRNYKCKLTELN